MMSDHTPNRLREMPATFNLDAAPGWGVSGGDGKTYRAKVFKTGNSLALRLPAALGLEAGMEMELTANPGGTYTFSRAAMPMQRIDITGFAGKLPGFMPAPREDFEERPSTIARRKAQSAG